MHIQKNVPSFNKQSMARYHTDLLDEQQQAAGTKVEVWLINQP